MCAARDQTHAYDSLDGAYEHGAPGGFAVRSVVDGAIVDGCARVLRRARRALFRAAHGQTPTYDSLDEGCEHSAPGGFAVRLAVGEPIVDG